MTTSKKQDHGKSVTVPTAKAKKNFCHLVSLASIGNTVFITHRGALKARLVPAFDADINADLLQAIKRLTAACGSALLDSADGALIVMPERAERFNAARENALAAIQRAEQ